MEISNITGNRILQPTSKAANHFTSEGNNLPPPSSDDMVTIGESSQIHFKKTLKQTDNPLSTPQLIGGHDAIMGLGMMALGGENQFGKWKKDGLEISEESILSASKIFQDGFKELMNKHASTSEGLSINRHQIIMNSQNTPDWFNAEYQNELSLMGDTETKRAFEQGAVYHLSQHNYATTRALSAYESV